MIAHPGDLSPGDLRPLPPGWLREVFDGLTDHLDLSDDRILPHAIPGERLSPTAA